MSVVNNVTLPVVYYRYGSIFICVIVLLSLHHALRRFIRTLYLRLEVLNGAYRDFVLIRGLGNYLTTFDDGSTEHHLALSRIRQSVTSSKTNATYLPFALTEVSSLLTVESPGIYRLKLNLNIFCATQCNAFALWNYNNTNFIATYYHFIDAALGRDVRELLLKQSSSGTHVSELINGSLQQCCSGYSNVIEVHSGQSTAGRCPLAIFIVPQDWSIFAQYQRTSVSMPTGYDIVRENTGNILNMKFSQLGRRMSTFLGAVESIVSPGGISLHQNHQVYTSPSSTSDSDSVDRQPQSDIEMQSAAPYRQQIAEGSAAASDWGLRNRVGNHRIEVTPSSSSLVDISFGYFHLGSCNVFVDPESMQCKQLTNPVIDTIIATEAKQLMSVQEVFGKYKPKPKRTHSQPSVVALADIRVQPMIPSTNSVESTTEEDNITTEDECVVCLSQPRVVILLPCRHLCLCLECLGQVDKCPTCRASISEYLAFNDNGSKLGIRVPVLK